MQENGIRVGPTVKQAVAKDKRQTHLVRGRAGQSLRLHVHDREVPPEATEALGTKRVEVNPSFLAQEMSEHLVHHLNRVSQATTENTAITGDTSPGGGFGGRITKTIEWSGYHRSQWNELMSIGGFVATVHKEGWHEGTNSHPAKKK